MPGTAVEAARDARLEQAFATEERRALKLLMLGRGGVIAAVVIFLLIQFPNASGLYWSALTLVFGLVGIANYKITQSRLFRPWQLYIFVALDAAIITFIILYPNPYLAEIFPYGQQLKYPNFEYLYLVVALSAMTFAPGLVAWSGFAAVAAWGTAAVLILMKPGIFSQFDIANYSGLSVAERAALWADNNFVDVSALTQQFFIMVVIAAVLAAAAWRPSARRAPDRRTRPTRSPAPAPCWPASRTGTPRAHAAASRASPSASASISARR